ncbi:hypothetical protein SLA2020_165600 [Shorea laevis]
MQREDNFHPDSGICRRLFRYIFNALGTQGLYTRTRPKSGDDMRIKPRKEDDDPGCEVKILFKKTDEPEYWNSDNFEVVPENYRPKIDTYVEGEDKEKKNGKMVVGKRPTTVIPDQPEHPRVLLNVDSNINEKSDAYIQSRKARMENIDIERKKY